MTFKCSLHANFHQCSLRELLVYLRISLLDCQFEAITCLKALYKELWIDGNNLKNRWDWPLTGSLSTTA